jgi:hypothetical protein
VRPDELRQGKIPIIYYLARCDNPEGCFLIVQYMFRPTVLIFAWPNAILILHKC